MKEKVELLAAMSNERRLQILTHLAHKERKVGELVEHVGVSQSALSQHLAILRSQKLVATRRDAKTIYYSLTSPAVLAVLSALDQALAIPDAPSQPSMHDVRHREERAGPTPDGRHMASDH